ncbi:fam-l protein [Plasmodium malariae]|uniref:Fam-l protein n=1 Tax=Plasmodium malariae TaxID=5858 RepID=A0A1D3JLC0_PLAMA|nr:fam-l protein [Plasmodium malariae]SBT87256.1 fam-l protein [Plasmodium malariae]
MKKKIKLLLFNKIVVFIVLPWMCYFNNYLEDNHVLIRTLDTRIYRLLGKCNKFNDSYNIDLTEDISHNKSYEKKDIFYNENIVTKQNEQSKRNSLNNASERKKATKNRSCIYETKKYSNLEKKIFKELDYTDFLKNNRTVSDRIYQKIICKKYGLRIALPLLLFLLLLIVFIVELTLGLSGKECLLSYFGLKKDHLDELVKEDSGPLSSFVNVLKKLTGFWEHSGIFGSKNDCNLCKDASESISNVCILGRFFRILICFVPFVILGFTIISWIIYYHKKVKKYEKIKLRKR